MTKLTENKENITEETSLHWSQHKEQAAGYWQLKFTLILFRILPVFLLRIIAFPVGFFYFIFSKRARTESSRFLNIVSGFIDDPRLAKKCRSFFGPLRHIISFSLSLIEKLQAWGGRYSYNDIFFQDDDINDLTSLLEEGKGAFLLISHLGNAMLLQGLLNLGKIKVSRKIPVTAIIDMKVNAHFSRILNEVNPESSIEIFGADELGANTAVLMEERISSGGLVLIAGDRTSIDGVNVRIPFLGKDASFSSGIFYLTALVKAPVYLIFGLRRGDLSIRPKYNMFVHKSQILFDCPRKERFNRCSLFIEYFAGLLEKYCRKHPFQWYNFFDFWQESSVKDKSLQDKE